MPLVAQSLLLDVTRAGDGALVAVGERGHIIWSADGKSWQQAEAVPARATLTAVTSREGRLWAAGHDSVILTSGDNGRTWTLQNSDPEREQPILDILFMDAEHGLAVGAYGLFLVTYDGGISWEDSQVCEEEWHLNSLVELDNGQLLIAGEAGYSYLSEDAGETWVQLQLPYQGSLWNGLAQPGGCALLFGLRGHLLHSCDAGGQWDELDTGTQASLSGGFNLADGYILAGNSGTVVEGNPDGSISASLHPGGVDFAAVIDNGPGRFLLIGEDGVHDWPPAATDSTP
jgi:photosystem II stability/assembly factor-like uncharacterized protein